MQEFGRDILLSMSLFAKVFGAGGKGSKTPSAQESIQRLRDIEEMLQKKSEFLEKKIEQELAFAKKNGTKNKKGMCFQVELQSVTYIEDIRS